MLAPGLSDESERRLLGALDQIASLTDSGGEPNDAIAKVATSLKLPVGHVPLLVQAYNTGRTEIQRLSGKTAAERAAKFPLADHTEIVRRMFPAEPKTAEYCGDVSADFQRPPARQKTSAIRPVSLTYRMPPEPPEPKVLMAESYYKAAGLRRNLEETRREAAAAQDNLVGCMGRFAELYKRADPALRGAVFDNLPIMFGDPGRRLLEYTAQRDGKLKVAAVGATRAAGPIYDAAAACMAGAEALIAARRKLAEATRSTDQEVERLLRPFGRPPGVLDGLHRRKTADFGVGGYALGTGMGIGAYDMLGNLGGAIPAISDDTAKAVAERVLQLEDPGHQLELQRIRSEAMLNDLMANDDVIAGHDPADVVGAYNEFAQMFPRAANQGGLVRSVLRKWLTHGSMEPFELAELTNTEQRLRTLHEPSDFHAADYGLALPQSRPRQLAAPTATNKK